MMTVNQIAYWNYLENVRSNQSVESETKRHNLTYEAETERHNRATEQNQYLQALAAQTSAAAAWKQAETQAQHVEYQYQLGRDRNIIADQQYVLDKKADHRAQSKYEAEMPYYEEMAAQAYEQAKTDMYTDWIDSLTSGLAKVSSAIKGSGIYDTVLDWFS